MLCILEEGKRGKKRKVFKEGRGEGRENGGIPFFCLLERRGKEEIKEK